MGYIGLIISFLTSKWGKYLAIAMVGGVLWTHGYIRGGSHVRAQCEEKARKAVEAAGKQDAKADEGVKNSERETSISLTDLTKKQATRIEELEASAKLKNPDCIYPMPAPAQQPAPRSVRARSSKS